MSPRPADRLREFWNQRYGAGEFAYGTEPNDFLAAMADRFPPAAKVLCLADGEGRNGVWLAGRGCVVTAVDISERGMEKAARLAAERGVALDTELADLTEYDLGVARWDAIVSIFLHLPAKARADLHRRCLVALKPGGLMLFEAYGPGQLGRGTGGPPEAELLPSLAEVEREFAAGEVLHRHAGLREIREGRFHDGVGDVVQLLVRAL